MKGLNPAVLRGELTIGCNDEWVWGPTIAMCQDPRIFNGDGTPARMPLNRHPGWCDPRVSHVPVYFKGHPEQEDYPAPDTVFQVKSAHEFGAEFRWGKTLEEGLYYGANVGMAAINLAEILGANPIYLLGFDARAADAETQHHRNYPAEWRMDRVEDRVAVYGRWIKEFRRIAMMLRQDTRVINLNPDSAIDAFPKAKLSVHTEYFESMDLTIRTPAITPVGL